MFIQLLPCFCCSDIVGMVSYAPLFVNTNDIRYLSVSLKLHFRFLLNGWIINQDVAMSFHFRWNPDAIVFNSSQLYGTPSYWVQQFFTESSGATLLNSTLSGDSSSYYVEASAISFHANGSDYIQIKVATRLYMSSSDQISYDFCFWPNMNVLGWSTYFQAVNFGNKSVSLKVSLTGLDSSITKVSGSKKKVVTSASVMDENSFSNPEMVIIINNRWRNNQTWFAFLFCVVKTFLSQVFLFCFMEDCAARKLAGYAWGWSHGCSSAALVIVFRFGERICRYQDSNNVKRLLLPENLNNVKRNGM